jgi:hypothetical protein
MLLDQGSSNSIPLMTRCHSHLLCAMQIDGVVTPVPGLALEGLVVELRGQSLNGSATGSLASAPVSVQLASWQQETGASTMHVGHFRISSNQTGATDALLASGDAAISSQLGISVPASTASDASDATQSSAELLFDSLNGLRLVNISLGGVRLGIADMARRVGFEWQGTGDPVSFTDPWLYYVPSNPGVEPLQWNDRLLGPSLELGVAATVDVPAFDVKAVRATLLIKSNTSLVLQVSTSSHVVFKHPCPAATCSSTLCQPAFLVCILPDTLCLIAMQLSTCGLGSIY